MIGANSVINARMANYPDLNGATVVVTGGANGIGAAIVRAFRKQNARIYFCDLDERAGAALAQKLGDGAFFTKVDLTRESQITRWVKGVGKRSSPIRVLINNAARDPRMSLAS